MAVAGLHKASGLDSYLGNKERLTTRTASIRKMWRDLENGGNGKENGRQQMSSVFIGPKSSCSSYLEGESLESEDTLRISNEIENECPQSQLQMVHQEKEGGRKLFHERGNKSFEGHTIYSSSSLNNCSRAQWVGENECKRVRIVREWIESSTQQGDTCITPGSVESPTQTGSQIDDGTLRGANEIENECPQSQNQMMLQENEGVRKLFHERENKSFEGHTVYSSSSLNNCSRAQWVGENECKRVRIVRDWIESSSQQGDTCRTPGSIESPTQTGSRIDGARSSIRRIYGRQALLDLLTKFVRERKREVDDLLENRFVSSFAHRHRIQSLLKGRFLRNQRFVEDEKQTYVAASELGFLRQIHVVSDTRKGYLTRLNNYGNAAQSDPDTSSDNEMNNYDIEQTGEIVQEIPPEISDNFETTNLTSHRESNNLPESPSGVGTMHDNNILQYEETEILPITVDSSRRAAQSDSDTSSDNDTTYEHTRQVELVGENFETTIFTSNRESTNPQEYTQTDSDSDTSSESDMKFARNDRADGVVHDIPNVSHNPQELHDDDGDWYQETVGSDFQESHEEEWYGNGNVVEDHTESWFGGNNPYLEAALVTRRNTFYWSDDDDSGSRVVELRELTNRRSVSNLLQSDFGPRLDQLMQSYVSRQDQAFQSENEWMQDHDQQQSLDENANGIDESPQTHVDHHLHGAADSRFPDSHCHLATGLDIINGLRIDMETLEHRMNDMQKMLEACMDMQIELQQSLQQEVYSALNRSSASRGEFEDGMWNNQSKSSPENRECFLCCDDGFESLPDRFAQMLHICSTCAQKVNWSKLKESVRQP